MSKKKKAIIISVVAVVLIILIGGLIYWFGFSNFKSDTVLEAETSKTNQFYKQLQEKTTFSFTTTLDEKNKMDYAKKDNKAYVDTIYNGKESKFIIKDGNSYLLLEEDALYYTYQNNETDLNKITLNLEEVKDKQYTTGRERVGNMSYSYEEFGTATPFLVKDVTEEEKQTAKTRFYFNGDQLIYIKTVIGDYEEVLKVEMSDQVDDNLFEIPEGYQEG